MNDIGNKLALLGLALIAFAFAVALFVGAANLLGHLDMNGFGVASSRASALQPPVSSPSNQINIAALQGMLSLIIQGLSFLALTVALMVMVAVATALVGLGGVCLHTMVAQPLQSPAAPLHPVAEPLPHPPYIASDGSFALTPSRT